MRCLQHVLWRGVMALGLIAFGTLGALAPTQAANHPMPAHHARAVLAGEDCVSVAAR